MNENRGFRADGWDPYENMPLELMMLVGVRSDALVNYRSLDEDRRAALDDMARRAKGRMEKERLIDRIERGDFS